MAPPDLLTLPPELQDEITTFVLYPSHLKNLRLSCKQLSTIASSQLYHRLEIDLAKSDLNDPIYVKGHSAHGYIRVLQFYDSRWGEQKDAELSLQKVRNLLALLPNDGLKGFGITGKLQLDRATAVFLIATQRNMVAVWLDCIGDSLFALPAVLDSWALQLQRLSIQPQDAPQLKTYKKILGQASAISSLGTSLPRASQDQDQQQFMQKLDDTAKEDGLFSTTLLNVRSRHDSHDPMMRLKHFTASKMNLQFADRTLTRAINFQQLTYLHLWYTGGINHFLQAITTLFSKKGCSLQGFAWAQNHNAGEAKSLERTANLAVLEAFVQCFSGLRYLNFDFEQAHGSFDMTCIGVHQSTLSHLMYSHGKNDPSWRTHHVPIVLSQLQDLCKSCRRLRQIAIALPPVDIETAFKDSAAAFWTHLDALSSLPDLVMLRILTWPKVRDSFLENVEGPDEHQPPDTRLNVGLFDENILSLAGRIFRLFHSKPNSRLKIVCFGEDLDGDYASDMDGQWWHFIESRFYSLRRMDSDPSTVRIERGMVRYEVPEFPIWSQVLQNDQGLGVSQYNSLK